MDGRIRGIARQAFRAHVLVLPQGALDSWPCTSTYAHACIGIALSPRGRYCVLVRK